MASFAGGVEQRGCRALAHRSGHVVDRSQLLDGCQAPNERGGLEEGQKGEGEDK